MVKLSVAVLILVLLMPLFTIAFGQDTGVHFVRIAPCRILDTSGPPASPADESERRVRLDATPCSQTLPAYALGYSVKVVTSPMASEKLANGTAATRELIVPATPTGLLNLPVTSDAHLVFDIDGYYVGTGTPIEPASDHPPAVPHSVFNRAATTLDVVNNDLYVNGKIGVGLSSPPAVFLDVKGDNVPYGGQLRLQASDYAQISFYNSAAPQLTNANRLGDIYYDIFNSQMVVDNHQAGGLLLNPSGAKVGIGTMAPTERLDVRGGNVNVGGNIVASGSITGGTVYATYQDVAEWVPVEGAPPAGTVVVLNRAKVNEVTPCVKAYDTAVAGVVSGQPGLLLGTASESKAKIATTGRVKVRVSARTHPVMIGDLLVTSDIRGTAMFSEPIDVGGVKIHRPGTVVGKALEPLSSGEGEILVLLSLQ